MCRWLKTAGRCVVSVRPIGIGYPLTYPFALLIWFGDELVNIMLRLRQNPIGWDVTAGEGLTG